MALSTIQGRMVNVLIRNEGDDAFVGFAYAKAHGMNVANSEVDVTVKTFSTDIIERLLETTASSRSVSMNLSGIMANDEAFQQLSATAFSSTDVGLLFEFEFGDGTGKMAGKFQVSGFDVSSQTEDMAEFSCSLSSAGAITFTPLPD